MGEREDVLGTLCGDPLRKYKSLERALRCVRRLEPTAVAVRLGTGVAGSYGALRGPKENATGCYPRVQHTCPSASETDAHRSSNQQWDSLPVGVVVLLDLVGALLVLRTGYFVSLGTLSLY